MTELILIWWLFEIGSALIKVGLLMLAIGGGYAIVEWVGERLTDKGEA